MTIFRLHSFVKCMAWLLQPGRVCNQATIKKHAKMAPFVVSPVHDSHRWAGEFHMDICTNIDCRTAKKTVDCLDRCKASPTSSMNLAFQFSVPEAGNSNMALFLRFLL